MKTKDYLIIVGSGPCVFDDLERIEDHSRFDFMAINHSSPAFIHIERIDHLVCHENKFPTAKRMRKRAGLNTDYITYSNEDHPGVDKIFADLTPPTCAYDCPSRLQGSDPRNLHHYSGTSVMLGLKIALRLGYKKIIIAGAPLNEGTYAAYQKGWLWIADILRQCPVRAMSGFTKDIFGEYTEDWLHE